jgi:hypothetical protein
MTFFLFLPMTYRKSDNSNYVIYIMMRRCNSAAQGPLMTQDASSTEFTHHSRSAIDAYLAARRLSGRVRKREYRRGLTAKSAYRDRGTHCHKLNSRPKSEEL